MLLLIVGHMNHTDSKQTTFHDNIGHDQPPYSDLPILLLQLLLLIVVVVVFSKTAIIEPNQKDVSE